MSADGGGRCVSSNKREGGWAVLVSSGVHVNDLVNCFRVD